MIITIHILSLVIFIFTALDMKYLALNNEINSNAGSYLEGVREDAAGSAVNAMDDNCLCDMAVMNSNGCCCKSPRFEDDLRRLVTTRSGNNSKLFDTIMNSIECFEASDDYHIGSLSDYEPPNRNMPICFLEETGLSPCNQHNRLSEPHVVLPYRPP